MSSTRPIDAQITDVKKICAMVLEALLGNLDDFVTMPRAQQYVRIAKIVCEVAQGFGCDGDDIQVILDSVRRGLEEMAREAHLMSSIPGFSKN